MKILHIDVSGRPDLGQVPQQGAFGSYSRHLSRHFLEKFKEKHPDAEIRHRDLETNPPRPVDRSWIEAAFNPEGPTEEQKRALAESDELVDELLWADMLVIGTPMYNFGMPSNLKAWIDNVVRVGRTLLINPTPTNPHDAIIPYFKGKRFPLVLLSSRGDYGLDEGGEFQHMNHLDPAVRTAAGFLGIGEVHGIAIENVTAGGEALDDSVKQALARSEALADRLAASLREAAEEDRAADAVRGLFAALAVQDFDAYRAVTTEDMEAYDLGFHLTRDGVVEFIKGAFAAGNTFEWNVTEPRVHITGDDAWMTYINRGSAGNAEGKQAKQWLESVVLRRENGVWKVRFLHSTEAASA